MPPLGPGGGYEDLPVFSPKSDSASAVDGEEAFGISEEPKVAEVDALTTEHSESPAVEDEAADDVFRIEDLNLKDSPSVEAWRQFAADIGLDCDDADIGLGLCIDGDRIYSAVESIVETPVGASGWIESRHVAFATAELRAKAKMAATLSKVLRTGKVLSKLSDLPPRSAIRKKRGLKIAMNGMTCASGLKCLLKKARILPRRN